MKIRIDMIRAKTILDKTREKTKIDNIRSKTNRQHKIKDNSKDR